MDRIVGQASHPSGEQGAHTVDDRVTPNLVERAPPGSDLVQLAGVHSDALAAVAAPAARLDLSGLHVPVDTQVPQLRPGEDASVLRRGSLGSLDALSPPVWSSWHGPSVRPSRRTVLAAPTTCGQASRSSDPVEKAFEDRSVVITTDRSSTGERGWAREGLSAGEAGGPPSAGTGVDLSADEPLTARPAGGRCRGRLVVAAEPGEDGDERRDLLRGGVADDLDGGRTGCLGGFDARRVLGGLRCVGSGHQSGMFPCFFAGSEARFVLRARSALLTFMRVLLGVMTVSM